MRPETVMIKTDNGPVLINREDYREGEHELYVEGMTPPAEIVVPPADDPNGPTVFQQQPAPEQMFVQKDGKKFIAVTKDGVPVEREGIEKDGYKSEADAWAAITALAASAGQNNG